MISIHSRRTTKGNFNNNGLAILHECLQAELTQELNGDYSLELSYPSTSQKAGYLEQYNIIKADEQLFRIFKIEKTSSNEKIIKVWAKHIFYDLLYYFVENKELANVDVKTALSNLLVDDLSTIYTVDSDISIKESKKFVECNPVDGVFKIIENWGGGELTRDNYDIKILIKSGNDNGVLIKYGKNIHGIKITTDTSNVVTRLYPVGSGNVRLTEKFVNVPNWDSSAYPPFPLIKKVEFQDAADEPTLRAMAQAVANKIGLSSVNIEVDFIELSKTREYEKYKQLETVKVGDLVTVRHKELNIDVKMQVIKIKKDLLTGLNTKIELGEPRQSILDKLDPKAFISSMSSLMDSKMQDAVNSIMYYANPVALVVGTSSIQPIYLGISAVKNTNVSVNLAVHGVASAACTLTMKLQLDGVDLAFEAKQKLQPGDNLIGIPMGLPQVPAGSHYFGVFMSVDTGSFSIPLFNLQCLIDGRNLQGGLSSEPPHAEGLLSITADNVLALISGWEDRPSADRVSTKVPEIILFNPITADAGISINQMNGEAAAYWLNFVEANIHMPMNATLILKRLGDYWFTKVPYLLNVDENKLNTNDLITVRREFNYSGSINDLTTLKEFMSNEIDLSFYKSISSIDIV